MVHSNSMDRGSETLKSILGSADVKQMEIRQTRRGWLQECLGCEAKTEFKYFVGTTQVAHSLDKSDCCLRLMCPATYPFQTIVTDAEGSSNELIKVDRPFVCCAAGPAKCCCYQNATVMSAGAKLGSATETCYCCVPTIMIRGPEDEDLFKLRPPTCCGGLCVNCCAEGNPCTSQGCCKSSFRFYPADQEDCDGDAPYVGKILKQPKSLATELFTDADSFVVDFPEGSSAAQKGLLMGSAVFLNALFFEGEQAQGA